MSEYDIRCINCFHRSHEDKECPYCSEDNRCTEFARADLFVARCLGRFEQMYGQAHQQTMMALSTIFDLLAEAYPGAATALRTRLEAHQKAAEEQREADRANALAEADEALKAAREAEDAKKVEEVAEEYVSNIIQFPSTKPEPSPFNPSDIYS